MRAIFRILPAWLAIVGLSAWTCSVQAAQLNLASAPLFLGSSVDANVFFTLDDSGSMDWETLTDTRYDFYEAYWRNYGPNKITTGTWVSSVSSYYGTSSRELVYLYAESDRIYEYWSTGLATAEDYPETLVRDWRARSADFNFVYYDPNQVYTPWPGKSNASFTAARSNPQSGSTGYSRLRDLSGFVFEVWTDDHGYQGSVPNGPGDATDGPNGIVDLWDSHTRYIIGGSGFEVQSHQVPSAASMAALNTNCNVSDAYDSVPYEDCFGTNLTTVSYGSSDLNPWGRTLAEEKQNIANWYQYYRKRSFVAKAAIARIINNVDDFRYGLSVINEYSSLFVEVPAASVVDYTSHNDSLVNALYSFRWLQRNTPLRPGLQRAGRYFDNDLSGKADPIVSQCQQNFSILLTDGYWTYETPTSTIGDEDGDGYRQTLADVAKYYYDKDLSPLPNNVPTSVLDGNKKQHMVTFTVAYGVVGDLEDTDNDGWPNPALGEDDDWGDPTNDSVAANPAKVDDLWHAAYNTKGEYLNARSTQEVVDALTASLAEISDRVGSSASVATNSGSLHEGSKLFQARFDSSNWSGELLAYSLNEDGSVNGDPVWEAADVLDAQHFSSGRSIITFNPDVDLPVGGSVEGRGVPFRFPSNYRSPHATTGLSSTQISQLMSNAPYSLSSTTSSRVAANQAYGQALLNFLRGDRSNEGSGTYSFRRRDAVLGDLVDSDPQFVGRPLFRYPDNLQAKPYSTFRAHYADRDRMVYVGGNDGMLHGFDESNGRERIAYIPYKVFNNLRELADPLYMHRYYVNEAPTIVDAWLPSRIDPISGTAGAWRTVLAGALGGGGQAIYALDVTDPDEFSEANAGDIVLWEFDDGDDADLGYTYSVPSIAKMANGTWAAVFGNGYNNTYADGRASSTGNAVLYIVNLETGALIKKIDTKVGSTSTPNGLASPALVDVNGDSVVDYIYAGDLRGNMWKFNVSGSNTSQWDVAYKSGSTPKPLFAAGSSQPITTRPQVTMHPAGFDGYMVYFGTGKYLEINDDNPAGASLQSFYGIWDKNLNSLTSFSRSNLLQQKISNQYVKSYDTDNDGVNDQDYTLRDVSDNTIDYTTQLGWYIDLIPEKIEGVLNSNNFGERQVSNALVRDGRVIFTTLIPSQGVCDYGGSSFIMELDYRDGSRLPYPAFDLNGDGEFDLSDTLAAGKLADVGIVPTVSILSDSNRDIAYGSGSSGDIDVIELNVGGSYLGRQSWRQLR